MWMMQSQAVPSLAFLHFVWRLNLKAERSRSMTLIQLLLGCVCCLLQSFRGLFIAVHTTRSWSSPTTTRASNVAILLLIAKLLTWSMYRIYRLRLKHHMMKLSSYLFRASVVVQDSQLYRSNGNTSTGNGFATNRISLSVFSKSSWLHHLHCCCHYHPHIQLIFL